MENNEFYKLLDEVVTHENIGNFNNHVGSTSDGFGEVHGNSRIEQVKNGHFRLTDWAVGKGLKLANTCFMKSINHLITCKLCHIENVADYISTMLNYRLHK